MSFLKTQSFSEGLKPGDTIQNITDKRVANIQKACGMGWVVWLDTHDGRRHQTISHEVINLCWRRVDK